MSQGEREQRKTPRYSFNGTAVIRLAGKAETARLRVVGLGISGCRIEIGQPIKEDQEFQPIIQSSGEQIITNVVVRHWNPKGFAGLRFTSMSSEARRKLEQLVDYVSRNYTEGEGGR